MRDPRKWMRMKWDKYERRDFGKIFLASLRKTVRLIYTECHIGKVVAE